MESRVKELESFFDRFPDMPREVILKEDVLRLGMRFTDAALDSFKDATIKSYRLFSHDKVEHGRLEKKEHMKIPEELRFKEGPYDLRPTLVRCSISRDSPYVIDVVEGKISLCTDGIVLAEAEYARRPKYYSLTFDDGVLYWEVVPLLGFGRLPFVTVYKICQLWGHKEECKFCDINENVRQKEKYGTPFTIRKAYKDVNQVAEVMATIMKEKEQEPLSRVVGYLVTGGTILTEVDGLGEIDFYLRYVQAIKERIGNRVPCCLQIQARTKEEWKRIHNAGVDVVNANIEVWDERLFKIICPGKERTVGRERWIRSVLESVDVFGEGNVIPNFVAGVEMSHPYGFKSVDEAVKSTTEGFEFLMSHGVVPRMNQWSMGQLSYLCRNYQQPIPPLEYFVRMVRNWYELWKKYGLPPLRGLGPMGPGRSIYQQSGMLDMGT